MTPKPTWEYLTTFLTGHLDFPDAVERSESLTWAGKSLTQQINDHAARGWEVIDLHWLSDKEVMVTFKRSATHKETS